MLPPLYVKMQAKKKDALTFTQEETDYMTKKLRSSEVLRMQKTLSSFLPSREPRRIQVLRSSLPRQVKYEIFRQLADNDSHKYHEWVDAALKLPIGIVSPRPAVEPAVFLKDALSKLDAQITGHAVAKQEVLRAICSWLQDGTGSGFAIGLEGEAGIGKTSFVKRGLSACVGRPFHFVSLGGASDASALLGHSYTYEGALPGRLAECLIRAKCCDPVIYFDELDKISTSAKGDELVHALIHLTDPIQKEHTRDRYFHGIDIDMSKAILVFSYNDPSKINPILLDRIKRIRMERPTTEERVEICEKHLVPRILGSICPTLDVDLPREVVRFVVDRNSADAGMRSIEKDVAHIIGSYALVKMYGSASVLNLPPDRAKALDLAFAESLFEPRVSQDASFLAMFA